MRLDFNVLWVEDQESAVDSQRERIAYLLRQQGFRLRATFEPDVESAKTLLSDGIYEDHVDLILMDYDLGPGPRGDTGLAEIRKILPYKDLIFYSALPGDLSQNAKVTEIGGVFLANRLDLPEVVFGVFETLVKKVLDIDHSRGLVMGAASDIDDHVIDCLTWAFDGCDPTAQANILEAIRSRVPELRANYEKDLAELEAVQHVSDLVDRHASYTSRDRVILLRKALKIISAHEDKDAVIVKYTEEIIPKRNDLAHVRVEETAGFGRRLVNRKGEEFTTAQMVKLRQELLESREMFEALSEALRPA